MSKFEVGDRVKVSLGSLSGLFGVVRNVTTDDEYKVLLEEMPGTPCLLQGACLEAAPYAPEPLAPAVADPTPPTGSGPGAKDDSGKLRYDLIPTALEEGVARVLTYGAFERPRADGSKGYGVNNWQGVKDARGRYYSALCRHMTAHRRGERVDKESGISHLSHAATNLAFLMSFEEGHDPVI